MKQAFESQIKLGYYRHYKGNVYQVFGVVTDTESLEPKVLYGSGKPEWVRSFTMFTESSVLIEGEYVPRFTFLGDNP